MGSKEKASGGGKTHTFGAKGKTLTYALDDWGFKWMHALSLCMYCALFLLVSTEEEDRQLCICSYLLAQLDIRSQEFRKTVVNKVDRWVQGAVLMARKVRNMG